MDAPTKYLAEMERLEKEADGAYEHVNHALIKFVSQSDFHWTKTDVIAAIVKAVRCYDGNVKKFGNERCKCG